MSLFVSYMAHVFKVSVEMLVHYSGTCRNLLYVCRYVT